MAKWLRMGSLILNAVATKALLITGAYFLGRYLDRRWGTDPWCLTALLLAAIGLGLWWIVLVLRRLEG